MADLRTVVADDVLVVYFPEHELMDEEQNRRIGSELLELTSRAPAGKMLVSFLGVDFVASSMLGQLVMLNKRCLSQNIALRICDVSPDLRMIFRIVRLDTLVAICGDEASALETFQHGTPPSGGTWESAEQYRAAAERGDAAACFGLGRCYEEGHGVEQEFSQALKWYQAAADQGHSGAQHALGMCCAYGMQVPQDYRKAILWFEKAAEQGHANAQYMLGVSYTHGLAGVQDYAAAAEWYLRAAEAGDLEAQVNLAEACLEGRGVAPDQAEALRWLRAAAERGHADAQANLAWFYWNGQGVPEDRDEAVRLYRQAAAQGHQVAQNTLQELEAA
jgi:anti-anti-sigma factor